MSEYIGKVTIDGGEQLPVGSTLYGTCSVASNVAEKTVALANFTTLIHGVTVHVKFTQGNIISTDNNLRLKVGTTTAYNIVCPGGSASWTAGAVISFTYDDVDHLWIANDSNMSNITISHTYNSNSTNAISGQGVSDALDTLGDASQKNVITSIVETGSGANKNSTDLPTTNAITAYVDSKTAGLTGAMHYVGRTTSALSDGLILTPIIVSGSNYTPQAGDVVLSSDHQEYVYDGSKWELLGDEGSYALKSNTTSVVGSITFTADTPSALTTKDTTIPNVTNAGSATTMTVSSGVLRVTTGAAPTLGDAITIKEVDTWTPGSAASLQQTAATVIAGEASE